MSPNFHYMFKTLLQAVFREISNDVSLVQQLEEEGRRVFIRLRLIVSLVQQLEEDGDVSSYN